MQFDKSELEIMDGSLRNAIKLIDDIKEIQLADIFIDYEGIKARHLKLHDRVLEYLLLLEKTNE